MEHHMNWEDLQQTFIDGYTLGANYCRTSYAKGDVCTYVHKSLNFENIDLEINCIEKYFEVCAVKGKVTPLQARCGPEGG
jgi:hypothetical protein